MRSRPKSFINGKRAEKEKAWSKIDEFCNASTFSTKPYPTVCGRPLVNSKKKKNKNLPACLDWIPYAENVFKTACLACASHVWFELIFRHSSFFFWPKSSLVFVLRGAENCSVKTHCMLFHITYVVCKIIPKVSGCLLQVQEAVKCRVVDRHEDTNGDSGGSFQNGHAQLMVGSANTMLLIQENGL